MPFPFSRRNSNSVVAERRSPAAPRPASLFSLSDWALFDLPAPKPKPAPATTASSPARPQLQPLPENHSYTLTAADTAFHTPTPRRRTQSAAPRPMSAYTTALPPGAAEPVLVRPQWHTFNSYSAGCTRNAPAASTFARSTTFDRLDAPLPSDRSARRDLGLGQSHYTKRSAMADVQGSRLPVVPPRSHLRPSATTSLSSSSSSPSSSAPSSSTASPLPSRSSSLARSTNKSASSVEVHTPSPPSTPLTARHFNVSSPMGGHNSNTDFGPKLGSHEHEVIQFSQPVRKRNFAGSVSSVDRDPFKVRDGLQSRKASSGVYTPHTFPGPSVPTQQSRQNQPFPTTSPMNSTFPHDSSSQQRHKQAHRVRSLGSFQRFSMHLHNRETEPVPPPMPISNPRSSYHPHTQYVAHSKPSYSPTSARSGGSMSPPDTPTTPTSVNIVGHHSATARPVVIMSNDFGPGVDFSRSPVESTGLGLGLEDTKLEPAAPITPSYILRSSNQPPQLPPIDASPSALPSEPVAPKISPAPKRGRRKPVPRLDEDVLETLETAETARTDLRPHAL